MERADTKADRADIDGAASTVDEPGWLVTPPEAGPPETALPLEAQKSYLINKLNFLNFQNGTIHVNFEHARYDRSVSCKARPLPCSGDILECVWEEPDSVRHILDSYRFVSFFVADGPNALLVKPRMNWMDAKGIRFELPDKCVEVCNRRQGRHACDDIPVQLIQNSMLFQGRLLEFSTTSFLVQLSIAPPQTFQCIDADLPVNLIIPKGSEMIYSGNFTILKQGSGQANRKFVLEPQNKGIHRYGSKKYRSKRLKLVPSPNIIFRHPLTRQMVNLKVEDLSGSGLSVVEGIGSSLLLPGLMLPEVELSFADSLHIRFKAQVLYRKVSPGVGRAGDAISGLAILDMEGNEHLKLLALLHQAENQNSYISSRVEMNALWDFFFETGFIYPKKYAFIQANKEKIKDIYFKLYTQKPTIARHFIYQDKGCILAHMGMVRLYENSWLIHHHAARKRASVRAGLTVLNQIGGFTYDSHRLYSLHMKYLLCYFRPENHFPNSVFGGFARYAKDRQCCSLDDFVYYHNDPSRGDAHGLEPDWTIAPSRPEDIQELNTWYEHSSGGLMMEALDLDPQAYQVEGLAEEYRRHGFKKERLVISLRHGQRLKAVLVAHISDIGLNLSDLTNCIKVFVLDDEDLDPELLRRVLIKVFAANHLPPDMPVLLAPAGFAERRGIRFEKIYSLWILNTRYSDQYFGFIERIFRLAKDRSVPKDACSGNDNR
jgi:hypothetical protein